MDRLSIIGIIVGFGALLVGNFLEGGSVKSLLNGPAALIVFGGTIGASVLQTPMSSFRRALDIIRWIILPPPKAFDAGVQKIVQWAMTARREGLLGLENISEEEENLFARMGLQLLVDGNETEVIRRIMETDMLLKEQRDMDAVKFYESMGGYAPTIGILGAVLGLIHVMQNLNDPSQLGPGIAVAFVATIYGVGFANLLLLPMANKLQMYISEQSQYRELLIEGIIAIAEGESPGAIEIKLNSYLN